MIGPALRPMRTAPTVRPLWPHGPAGWMAAALVVLGLSAARTATPAPPPLRVHAAASLGAALAEVAEGFERAHPGTRVELNLAGTQVLRAQIEQGARADIFISADTLHAGALVRSGLLEATDRLAGNRLAVIAPGAPATVRTLADLAVPGVRVVVAAPTVPAGRYTEEMLRRAGAAGLAGGDFPARVAANVASRETNVRAVVAKVALGEADAGIVYVTDVAGEAASLRLVPIPDSLNVDAEYRIGVLTGAPDPGAARRFVAFMLGPAGRDALRRHGFEE